jgi:hypothetical protein
MGAAGRQRAVDCFAWSHIIKAYEDLWSRQERARRAHLARRREPAQALRTPSLYPPPERSFAGYPTRWLDEHESLETAPHAEQALDHLLALPLANYAADTRDQRRDCLSAVLAAAEPGCTLEQLTDVLQSNGTSFERSRATLAWMLKYGLLQTPEEDTNDLE